MHVRARRAEKVEHVPLLQGIGGHDAVWLVLMSVMLFILLLPVAGYVAALPYIKEEWGLNNTQSGVVYSAYLAGYAFSALLVVPLTDRLGPRHILVGSATVSVIAHILFPLVAGDMATGVALRVVAGLGLVGVYVPGMRVIAERFASGGRGTAVGLFVTAFYAAHSGSLAITGVLMSSLTWEKAYLAVAVAAIAGLPMAYLLLRTHGGETDRGSSGRLDLAVLRNPPVRYLILGYSLHALQLHAVRAWLPGFLLAVLIARGISVGQAAAAAATTAGLVLTIGSLGPVMGGIISDRWGRAASATAIFALSGTCAWVIGWTGDLPWALIVALGVVYGWAIAADSAIYSTGITEVASPAYLGSTMAMQAFLGMMGGVAGPIVFGGILDVSPEAYRWGVAFSALGLVALVAIGGLQRLRLMPQRRLLAKGKG